jgi:lipid II:glycine glycyltransferase (peptidoglycan interpeptide bridge formation enzyme)
MSDKQPDIHTLTAESKALTENIAGEFKAWARSAVERIEAFTVKINNSDLPDHIKKAIADNTFTAFMKSMDEIELSSFN